MPSYAVLTYEYTLNNSSLDKDELIQAENPTALEAAILARVLSLCTFHAATANYRKMRISYLTPSVQRPIALQLVYTDDKEKPVAVSRESIDKERFKRSLERSQEANSVIEI